MNNSYYSNFLSKIKNKKFNNCNISIINRKNEFLISINLNNSNLSEFEHYELGPFSSFKTTQNYYQLISSLLDEEKLLIFSHDVEYNQVIKLKCKCVLKKVFPWSNDFKLPDYIKLADDYKWDLENLFQYIDKCEGHKELIEEFYQCNDNCYSYNLLDDFTICEFIKQDYPIIEFFEIVERFSKDYEWYLISGGKPRRASYEFADFNPHCGVKYKILNWREKYDEN